MKKLKTIDWYIITLVMAVISAVSLRTYALSNSFNDVTKYYENSLASTICNIILVVGVLIFVSYIFLGEKDHELLANNDNAATYIPAGIVSAALLFMGIERFNSIPAVGEATPLIRTLSILTAVLAILSVASFFVSIFIEKKHSIYKASFSLSVVFFLALYASLLFFSTNGHPTNSPNRILDQMTYLFAATFFLFETRIHLGRAKWRLYVAFGLAATLLCFTSAIPSIVMYFVDGYLVSASIIESALSLTLAIFIASRVFQSRDLTPDAECDVAQSISALAALREEEIKKQRSLAHAHEDNNVETESTQDSSNYTFDIPYVDPSVDLNPDGADIDLSKESDD